MKTMMAAAAGLLLAGGAAAADLQGFAGAKEIVRGDYPAAERAIVAQQRLFPRDPDLLLNLAYVYARTGRTADAQRLYREVAAQPDELLDLTGGRPLRAHAVAAAGLRQLDRQVAAR